MKRFLILLILFLLVSPFTLFGSELSIDSNMVNVNKNSMGVSGAYIPPVSGGFPVGWLYRKPVTISRATGAVSNYQMRIFLGETSGATGEDVDCEGHCNADFSDVRFTNNGIHLLDYWIESISGVSPNQLATIWVEFDSIGTGDTTFYMYYGNAAATSESNGSKTFLLFDDFDDGSLDLTKWTSVTAVNGTVTESGTTVKMEPTTDASSNANIKSLSTFVNNHRGRIKVRYETNFVANNFPASGFAAGSNEDGTGFLDAAFQRWTGTTSTFSTRKDGGTVQATDISASLITDGSTYNLLDITYISGTCTLTIGTSLVATHNTAGQVPTTDPLKMVAGSRNTTAPSNGIWVEADWIMVGSYVSPEPAFGAWGPEESL